MLFVEKVGAVLVQFYCETMETVEIIEKNSPLDCSLVESSGYKRDSRDGRKRFGELRIKRLGVRVTPGALISPLYLGVKYFFNPTDARAVLRWLPCLACQASGDRK